MKRFLTVLIIIASFYSCDDSFSPIGEFEDKYILSAVLNGDTAVQTITISKSYMIENLSENKTVKNLWIKGAEVTVAYDDTAFVFNELQNDITKYEAGGFQLPFDKILKIEALLPDGRWIRSYTKTPKQVSFRGESNQFIPPDYGGNIYSVAWQSFERDVNFVPKLTLEYYINIDGVFKRNMIEVPIKYVKNEGKETPIYPSVSNQIGVGFELSALEKTLKNIYDDQYRKQDYYISKALRFELIILDQNLTSYYLITNNVLDNYSVRLGESEFSNVEGGIGIFGSFIQQNYFMYMTEEFINSFGYSIKTN
ncbi:MAG: hypothetical protein CMF23_07440 [Ignavibacteriae bacterium]|nr:hypothetical protein [Ignavibacteriota bacterium]